MEIHLKHLFMSLPIHSLCMKLKLDVLTQVADSSSWAGGGFLRGNPLSSDDPNNSG